MKAKIEKSIAKNNGMNNKNASSKAKFFELIIKQINEHFTGDNASNYQRVQCVVVGSPGFVAENFFKHLQEIVSKNSSEAFLKDF